MARSLTARRAAAAFVSALLLLGTAACGGGSDEKGSGDGTSGEGASRDSAFPVTIPHKFGEAKIPAEPKRIVTLGLTDQDAVLAAGKVPVGTMDWIGGFEGAVGPWAQDELGSATVPTVLKDTGTGAQIEKVAALDPDLIVAVYGGLTKEQYRTLSKFAPVVAQPAKYQDYGVPWQEQATIVGKAVGGSEAAAKAVADVEARIAAAARPEFENATAVMGTPYEGIFLYGSQDPRSRLLTDLGFSLPAGLDKAIGGKFGANISKERTDLLDQDAVVWMLGDVEKDGAKLREDPSYGGLKAVKEGREVYIHETSDYGYAATFGTVLSLPYVLDRLVPQLTAAVDGKPETKVEQPAS
ncbi:iron-siderophore ABC transporter substrate-binding protein [Streptomyces yaizuensis]|uniref:Iron-siderophore ABC transporter substrate-binding protein n=1 Tax=Streptomyces yaizuensis TaxID=2989713 RepID=A0ABQ5P2V7_9ACTN|nr:iron-siderophore ABC transporter substrate-binding protein [Streptomyces sp. YSPA8]GLF96915.1 iron-siderophore ABC transporter substrate-binding protein [Streptomyces sp. YSPA8]